MRLEEKHVPGFWERVTKTNTCWIWNGSKDQCGYGLGKIKIAVNKWTTKRAHIISVLLSGREVSKGSHCDHLCDRPECVRPDHISVTSPRLNILRGKGASSINNKKTHCSDGHKLSEENLYFRKPRTRNGRKSRVCKKCHIKRVQKYLAGKK